MPSAPGGILFFNGTEYICLVQATRISIHEFLADAEGHLVLDVRSPAEYSHAHIPGAYSLPLFTDEERKIVGTAYKQESREKAIKIGLDFFGPKMRKMVEQVETLIKDRTPEANSSLSVVKRLKDPFPAQRPEPAEKLVFVYCWRGGMRSGAVSWLLSLYGFKVFTLSGGYKAFRNYVLRTFEQPYTLNVLGGYTGSGKTVVLNELEKRGEIVIDLENIAAHKGSAFGNLPMQQQSSQEMFENHLAIALRAAENRTGSGGNGIWLEDESQRIGNLNIPMNFWQAMRKAPLYFLEVPFEERLNYIVDDYGAAPVNKLMEATQRISKRLGGVETKNVLQLLEQGNIREAFRILLHYYDKRYLKGLHNREDISTLLNKINCATVTPLNTQALVNQYQSL